MAKTQSVKIKKPTLFSFNYDNTVHSHIDYVNSIEEKRANNLFSLVCADPESFQPGLTVPPISPQIPGKSLDLELIYPRVSMAHIFIQKKNTLHLQGSNNWFFGCTERHVLHLGDLRSAIPETADNYLRSVFDTHLGKNSGNTLAEFTISSIMEPMNPSVDIDDNCFPQMVTHDTMVDMYGEESEDNYKIRACDFFAKYV